MNTTKTDSIIGNPIAEACSCSCENYLQDNQTLPEYQLPATTIQPKAIKPTVDIVLDSAIVVKNTAITSSKMAQTVSSKTTSDSLTNVIKTDTTKPPIEIEDKSSSKSILNESDQLESFVKQNPKYVTYGLVALLAGLLVAYTKK